MLQLTQLGGFNNVGVAATFHAPPVLVTPTVINGDPTGGSPYAWGDTEDVLLNVGAVEVNAALEFVGGRNIRLIGGKWNYTQGATKTTPPDPSVIRWKDVKARVFIEGVHMLTGGRYIDHYQSFSAGFKTGHDVILQSCLSEGIAGQDIGVHGDFYESFSGIEAAWLETVTIKTAYAGIFLPYRGSNASGKWGPKRLYLMRVNAITDEVIRAANPDFLSHATESLNSRPNRYYFLQDNDEPFEHTRCDLVQVYAEMRDDIGAANDPLDWDKMLLPNQASAGWQSTLHVPGGGLPEWATYTEQPALNTTGRITEGLPPGGNFVLPGKVGTNYVSPWEI